MPSHNNSSQKLYLLMGVSIFTLIVILFTSYNIRNQKFQKTSKADLEQQEEPSLPEENLAAPINGVRVIISGNPSTFSTETTVGLAWCNISGKDCEINSETKNFAAGIDLSGQEIIWQTISLPFESSTYFRQEHGDDIPPYTIRAYLKQNDTLASKIWSANLYPYKNMVITIKTDTDINNQLAMITSTPMPTKIPTPTTTPIPSPTPASIPVGTPITSCGIISRSGNYYVKNGLQSTSCDCITIEGKSGITLDGNSQSIKGNTYTCSGIYIKNSNNINIKNFRKISGFENGITSFSSDKVTLENNDLSDNFDDTVGGGGNDWTETKCINSIYIFMAARCHGDDCKDTAGNTVKCEILNKNVCDQAASRICKKCSFKDRFGDFLGYAPGGGIVFTTTTNSVIRNNRGYHLAVGIKLVRSDRNLVENNDFSHESAWGIYLEGSSSNRILRNKFDDVWRIPNSESWAMHSADDCSKGGDAAGIFLVGIDKDNNWIGSNNNIISENSAQYGGDGIYLRSMAKPPNNNNQITNNDFSHAQTNCIEVGQSDNIIISGNKANSCGETGFFGYGIFTDQLSNSKIINNKIIGNGNIGIYLQDSVNVDIKDNTVTGTDKVYPGGNPNPNPIGIHIARFVNPAQPYPQDWINVWNIHERNRESLQPPFPSKNINIENNLITGNNYGIVIDKSENVKLKSNGLKNKVNIFFGFVDHQGNGVDDPAFSNRPSNGINVTNNNIKCENCELHVKSGQPNNIDAVNNYWYSTNLQEISSKIYDKDKNPAVGKVSYNPYLFTQPNRFNL